jgi:nitric oxide reductase NorD protein
MNRMRALMIRSSRRLGQPVVSIVNRWKAVRTSPVVELDTVRRRLELLLAAMYGTQFEIASVADEAPRNTPHLKRRRPIARHEGVPIQLPATMDAADSAQAAIARYRLLAIEQAARIVRGSAAFVPVDSNADQRDLYNLRESAVIDASIATSSPGVAALISKERSLALLTRPVLAKLSERERAVERLVLNVLRSDPAVIPEEMRAGSTPKDSQAWSGKTAGSIASLGGVYSPLPPVAVWGQTLDADMAMPDETGPQFGSLIPPSPGYGSGESAAPARDADNTHQELTPTGQDAARAADEAGERDDPGGVAVAGEAGAKGDAEPDAAGEARPPLARRDALNTTDAAILAMSRTGSAILYPEWDCNASMYRELGAVVHVRLATDGDAQWADRVLGEHPALVRRVRREFERLKARRVRMLRQREGEELDLAACVRAMADAMAGDSSDDRLYMAVRAARRAIAITVLVDVSASTSDMVADGRSVIEVEKATLLLASEAFDALGDWYSIHTFASNGAPNVRVTTVKGFDESNGESICRRIAGIEAGGKTRLGAAIRHATAILAAQPAAHRLLLILSDGKPNDVDRYFTTYAVEDSRQAIFEARAEGMYPFCLTIDAEDRDSYLERVFGTSGYTILRRPEQLPAALLDLVRQLLRGGG